MEYFVFIIPLAGIALGAFATWLDFKKETRKLGSSTDDLEREVKALKETVRGLKRQAEQRLRNLEAIVTSQAWDDLETQTPPLRDRFLEITEEEPEGASPEKEAARLARKVSG